MLEEEGLSSIQHDLSDEELLFDWTVWARPNQIAPTGHWYTWLILAGRGFGKTRSGAEWVRDQVENQGKRRIALVARTAADARDVLVEGESGILACSPSWFRPRYEPSKRRLTWPNGAIARCYSAEKPDELRGPQFDAAWCDELASWKYDADTWSNLSLGLRLGKSPRVVVTTTPRPTATLKEIIAERSTIIARGSTYENKANLAKEFIRKIKSQYEGTRLGLQEIHAEVLDDTPGALWTQALIDQHRIKSGMVPELERIVVAIDPAVTANEGSDETGIVVAGIAYDGEGKTRKAHGYVLDDLSGIMSPDAWAKLAIDAYRKREADRIVAEVNNGGDLVEVTLRTHDPKGKVAYSAVRASKGKRARSEPVAALYEQGRVHHVGAFARLESQLTTFVPGEKKQRSPDRMDALVWAITELMLDRDEFDTDFSMEQGEDETGDGYDLELGL